MLRPVQLSFLLPLLCIFVTQYSCANAHNLHVPKIDKIVKCTSVDVNNNGSAKANHDVVKVTCDQYTRLQKLRKYATNTVKTLIALGLLRTSGKLLFGSLKPEYSVQRRAFESLLCTSTALHLVNSAYLHYDYSEVASEQPTPSTELSHNASRIAHPTAMDRAKKIVQSMFRYSPIGSTLMCGYVAYMLPEFKSGMPDEHANCNKAFVIARLCFLGLGAHLVKNFYQSEKGIKAKKQVYAPKTQIIKAIAQQNN